MIEEDTLLAGRWEQLDAMKGDLHERHEQYALWTIPSLYPQDENANRDTPTESAKANVASGARLVNHLAHKVVDTMYPNDAPFFSLSLTADALADFEKEFASQGPVDEKDANKSPLATAKAELDAAFMQAENAAMRELNLTAYRPIAITSVQLQIVTGNALIYRMPEGERVVYSTRDYSVRRSISGKVLEVMLRDAKTFGTLDKEIQEAVVASNKGRKVYEDESDVNLYTHYEWRNGKWHMRQAVEEIEIDDAKTSYNETDFPCLVLAWNLGRGDHYGRGLVEDYAVSFHNIDVFTTAQIDMISIAADIKFLVNDSSTFDVDAWNNAKRGDYLPGKEGDITTPEFAFALELQYLSDAINKLERELAQAFLLSSAGVRDAERVTAEEIRFFAREIESAFGGLYSRLALDWQRKEAEFLLSQINFKQFLPNGRKTVDATVTTGLESLTREGKLDSLRVSIADLQLLDTVPEDVRSAINPLKFAAYIFGNRGVPYENFLFTASEMTANREAEQAAMNAQIEKQGEVQVASKAAAQS